MSLLSIHGDVLFDTVSPPAGLSDDLSLPFQNAQVISFLFFSFFFFMLSPVSENKSLISRGFYNFPAHVSQANFAYDQATPQISQNPLQRHVLLEASDSASKDKITLSLELASFAL